MKFVSVIAVLSASHVSAFSSLGKLPRGLNPLGSSLVVEEAPSVAIDMTEAVEESSQEVSGVTAAEINARLERQLAKLRVKDATSKQLSKQDIKVVFQDDHMIAVEKPSGVLCVPTKVGNHNLAQSVYDAYGSEFDRADKMAVHRLGMDTSGLVVLAKTMDAVRGMNTVFRTRAIERTYEALVCGHMEKDSGMISLPLMRDYEFPPFMRVSTDEHQRALIDLSVEDVGKKLLQQPKESLTNYEVVGREELNGLPVTRVTLTSVSGRTHQLNVHLAAFGHPIVGDKTYGFGGDAANNGGLSREEQDSLVVNPCRAGDDVQSALASHPSTCIHAKSVKFRHPVTKEDITLSCDAPF